MSGLFRPVRASSMWVCNGIVNIWEQIRRLWLFIRNFFERHHFVFIFTVFYTVVRIGIYFASLFWTSIYRFVIITRNALDSASSGTGGLSLLTGFSVVNAIFPVYELFVFLFTLLTVKSFATFYAFMRALYKNVPLKST